MISQEPSFYLLIFTIVSLVLICISLVILYLKLLKEFGDFKEGRKRGLDPQSLLTSATLRAQKLLENANSEARDVVKNASIYLKSEEGKIAKEIQKAADTNTKIFQEAVDQIKNDSLRQLSVLPQDIKLLMVSSVDNFRLGLQEELVKAQAQASQTVMNSFKKAQEEIDNYKKEKEKKIDEGALKLIAQLSKRVLGKDISLEEHEKMVVKALEEAKKQGFFENM